MSSFNLIFKFWYGTNTTFVSEPLNVENPVRGANLFRHDNSKAQLLSTTIGDWRLHRQNGCPFPPKVNTSFPGEGMSKRFLEHENSKVPKNTLTNFLMTCTITSVYQTTWVPRNKTNLWRVGSWHPRTTQTWRALYIERGRRIRSLYSENH